MHALLKVVVSRMSHFLEGFIVNPYSCGQSDNTELLYFFRRMFLRFFSEDFVKTEQSQTCWAYGLTA